MVARRFGSLVIRKNGNCATAVVRRGVVQGRPFDDRLVTAVDCPSTDKRCLSWPIRCGYFCDLVKYFKTTTAEWLWARSATGRLPLTYYVVSGPP